MRLSQMLFVTLRDDPADAEIPSHKLLLKEQIAQSAQSLIN